MGTVLIIQFPWEISKGFRTLADDVGATSNGFRAPDGRMRTKDRKIIELTFGQPDFFFLPDFRAFGRR